LAVTTALLMLYCVNNGQFVDLFNKMRKLPVILFGRSIHAPTIVIANISWKILTAAIIETYGLSHRKIGHVELTLLSLSMVLQR